MDRQVILEGGLPWGFRIQGGADTGLALRIARVNPGSKAALQGIREGDVITSINGQSTDQVSNSQAHSLLKDAGPILKLGLTQGSTLSRRMFKSLANMEDRANNKTTGTDSTTTQSSPTTTSVRVSSKPGVWSPGQQPSSDKGETENSSENHTKESEKKEITPVVWTPSSGRSPSLERKEFRPVRLETGSLRKQSSQDRESSAPRAAPPELPWQTNDGTTSSAITTPASEHSLLTASSTLTGLSWDRRASNLSSGTASSTPVVTPTSHLPKVPNPTVTLLQKAREGQLPKGATYLESREPNKTLYRSPFETLYTVKREYESEDDEKRKIVELSPKKFTGIGPTSDEGIPLALRTGIKEENQHQWYRRMYDSLHKAGRQDDYVTVRYKTGRARTGYLSEPEPFDYDSDFGYTGRYATLDRRRPRTREPDLNGTLSRSTYAADAYRNQPGRIENYEPGQSSIVAQQTKQVQKQINVPEKSFTSFALKESGYESDSQLIFRRRPEQEQILDPHEQKAWYRDIQRGGEVPLYGLRKPIPDRPQVGKQEWGDGSNEEHAAANAGHRFAESEVTIHYRSPVRNLQSQQQDIDEEELKQRQAEHMRRVYEQERRRKFLQELEDLESRRHTDNFTPSQKSPIPLNRYDDIIEEPPVLPQRDRTPEPKIVARALYNFIAQNARELSFQKGDIIFVRRQIDKNWYEGEHNAMIGIFPVNYVEIIPYDGIRMTPKKPNEGQARVKYNFVAQTPMELSLVKGEIVIVTRQVDDHWLEGRIGNRRGIFPLSYVEHIYSAPEKPSISKPTMQQAPPFSLMTNGSLRNTNYRNVQQYASMPKLRSSQPQQQQQPIYRPAVSTGRPMNQPNLHVDTRSEPVLYRALYSYTPQNDDELELLEGDTICVLEKCDDGWYVGTSQRTGLFGTFPGNYVERI